MCIQYRGGRGQALVRYSHWGHDDPQTMPMLLGMGDLPKAVGKEKLLLENDVIADGKWIGRKKKYTEHRKE